MIEFLAFIFSEVSLEILTSDRLRETVKALVYLELFIFVVPRNGCNFSRQVFLPVAY